MFETILILFLILQAGLAGAFAQMTLGAPRSSAQSALEDHFRRQSWEVGNIDYLGRDSFANIWQKISETLATPAVQESAGSTSAEQTQQPKSTTAKESTAGSTDGTNVSIAD